MPSRFPLDEAAARAWDDTTLQEQAQSVQNKAQERTRIAGRVSGVSRNDEAIQSGVTAQMQKQDSSSEQSYSQRPLKDSSPTGCITSTAELQSVRKVITSLPRAQTFQRQQSEKRINLLPVPDADPDRRSKSLEPRQRRSVSSPNTINCPAQTPSTSALGFTTSDYKHMSSTEDSPLNGRVDLTSTKQQDAKTYVDRSLTDRTVKDVLPSTDCIVEDDVDDVAIQQEFRDHWILNLSMHFRDKSNREKFFITYAQTRNLWRRMTISLDYREPPPNSLEEELHDLHYQRDKSFRIFDALRESLPEIQFYDTVTNLKLETTPEDGQLHVHVREDANEIIDYPSALLFEHIDCDSFKESELAFHSHISGFVYKVVVNGKLLIKKEIPGPDTIDEFIYEVNALNALQQYRNVIQLEGLITSNDGSKVRGLLLPYCAKGALVDVLYDWPPEDLTLALRLKWAQQIVQGLANIHEAGYVQGDFTLSNIVIDDNDDAHIIDINRRGCPVGWEPPELVPLIEQNQRISMYIGVKTDLFQLGMVLWGLAQLNDEPERCSRPLPEAEGMPSFYKDIVSSCLDDRPQARHSASILLRRMIRGVHAMPLTSQDTPLPQSRSFSEHTSSSHRSNKEYIDPRAAVTIDDVKDHRSLDAFSRYGSSTSHNDHAQSRGRSPCYSSRRRRSSVFDGAATSVTSISPGPAGDEYKATSYPQVLSNEDFDDDSQHLPHLYHGIRHEDSGFDEAMLESLTTGAVTAEQKHVREIQNSEQHRIQDAEPSTTPVLDR